MAIQTYKGVPLCHWCGWEVYDEMPSVGNKDYIAHDECHEAQT